MNKSVHVTRLINAPVEEVFRYFLEPRLIEKWSAPEGMTLKMPFFEAKIGGRYRYEHTNKEGTYICEGHLEEIIPGKKITMIDEWIKDPSGKTIMENLPCEVTFKSGNGETEISVTQFDFKDEEMRSMCEQGWNQSFDKLQQIFREKEEGEQLSA